jgi:hypothetical protein
MKKYKCNPPKANPIRVRRNDPLIAPPQKSGDCIANMGYQIDFAGEGIYTFRDSLDQSMMKIQG